MSNLYVDRKGIEIRIDGGALAFYDQNQRIGTVPLAPLSRVFLRGDVKFNASLLGKLGEHNIGVVILSGRKATPSLLMARPHNDARLRLSQYHCALQETVRLHIARWLVAEKIKAQKALLQETLDRRKLFRYELTLQLRQLKEILHQRLQKITNIDSLRGLEGAAAQAYFRGLSRIFPESLGFTGRNRRPPKDPANAVLSLGYTLLHHETVLSLYGSGFDPYIGFYHTLNHGRESLACDLVEPLRPLMDGLAIRLFARQTLRKEHFSTREGACLLGKAGRQHFYQEYDRLVYETLVKKLACQIREFKNKLLEVTNDQAFSPAENEGAYNARLSDLL